MGKIRHIFQRYFTSSKHDTGIIEDLVRFAILPFLWVNQPRSLGIVYLSPMREREGEFLRDEWWSKIEYLKLISHARVSKMAAIGAHVIPHQRRDSGEHHVRTCRPSRNSIWLWSQEHMFIKESQIAHFLEKTMNNLFRKAREIDQSI